MPGRLGLEIEGKPSGCIGERLLEGAPGPLDAGFMRFGATRTDGGGAEEGGLGIIEDM